MAPVYSPSLSPLLFSERRRLRHGVSVVQVLQLFATKRQSKMDKAGSLGPEINDPTEQWSNHIKKSCLYDPESLKHTWLGSKRKPLEKHRI